MEVNSKQEYAVHITVWRLLLRAKSPKKQRLMCTFTLISSSSFLLYSIFTVPYSIFYMNNSWTNSLIWIPNHVDSIFVTPYTILITQFSLHNTFIPPSFFVILYKQLLDQQLNVNSEPCSIPYSLHNTHFINNSLCLHWWVIIVVIVGSMYSL